MRQEPDRWLKVDGAVAPDDVFLRLLAALDARGIVPVRGGVR
jgi:hypothetical protein